MTDKEYLDAALELIVELHENDPSYFCETLHNVPKENEFCANNCENFDRFCLLRFLEYYKPKKE